MQTKTRAPRTPAQRLDEDDRAAVLASLRAMRRSMARDFMASAVAALDDSDLTLVQMATLMLLEGCGEVTVRALAERFGRSVSAASRMLDQLVRRRLVSRVVDKADRRVRRVGLAARGRALVEQMLADRTEAQLQIMQRLSARERAQVKRAMRILQQAAERGPTHEQVDE
jgi:DNA-binding MarR family transcriptional regulator